jgi:glycosyltransferase involved in cell wall biosynthesis
LYTFLPFIKKYTNKVVSDIHDYQYRRIENDVIPSVNFIDAFFYKLFFKNSELKALKKIDKIISISPIETKMIKEDIDHKHVVTIPATADNPYNIDNLKYQYDLTFIGSNSDANSDSIIWFLDNCFEEIVSKNKRVKLLIQGKIIRNKNLQNNLIIKKFLGRNILMKDFVLNLADIYSSSKMIIAPVVKGSGMKIKVIEALSYAKPIIGTDIAFEGIEIQHNESAIVANSAKEFIDAVNKLIFDESKIKELKKNAYNLFLNKYSFDSCIKKLRII